MDTNLSVSRGEIAMWQRFNTPLADAIAELVGVYHAKNKVMPAALVFGDGGTMFPKPIPDEDLKTMRDAFAKAVAVPA